MEKKYKAIAATLIVFGLFLSGFAAANYVMTSNNVSVTVTNSATLTLAVSSSSYILGVGQVPLLLTATCSDSSFTGSVSFVETSPGSMTLGSAFAIAGVATFTWIPTTAGTYVIDATASHS